MSATAARRPFSIRSLAAAFAFATACGAQTQPAPQTSQLSEHYRAAQTALAQGDRDKAAYESRMFLTDALGEIAINDAHAGEYAHASSAFEQALAFAPHSPVLLLEYAEAALHAGDLDTAKAVAAQAARDYPGNPKAHILLGEALLKQDKSAEARAQFVQAATIEPSFAASYDTVVACLNLGDAKCAASEADALRGDYGDSAVVELALGQAYLNSDFQNIALTDFKAAIAKDPQLPGAHYSLAAAYLATSNDVAKAEEELRREIALEPGEAVAYAALGHLEQGQHQDADAVRDLDKAVALAPGDPDAYLYLGQLYADEGRKADAITALRRSIALTTDISRNNTQVQRAHYLLGRLLLQTGAADEGKKELAISQTLSDNRLSQARDRLAAYYQEPDAAVGAKGAGEQEMQGVEATPAARAKAAALEKQLSIPIAETYDGLGVLAGQAAQDNAALAAFRHALEWDPALPGLDENMGRAAYGAGQYADAVGPLTRSIAGHPQDGSLRAALGISQAMTGENAAAVTTLTPLVSAGGAAPQVQFADGQALLHLGRAAEAVPVLRALVEKLPQSPQAHRELGEALAAANQPAAAEAELQDAVRLDPKDGRSWLDLARVDEAQGKKTEAAQALQTAAALAPHTPAAAARQ